MAKVVLPKDILDKETIDTGDCTHPAGHCYGSDGGSGIPANLKVAEGRGGEVEVWKLSTDKETVETKEVYARCQYCLKLNFKEVKDEEKSVEI